MTTQDEGSSGSRSGALVPVERNLVGPDYSVAAYDRIAPTTEAELLDLRGLWRIIKRYRWTIATVVAVALIITLVATLLMRPVYRAEALVKVNPSHGTVVKFQTVEQGETPTREYMATQSSVLKSSSVASMVIDELNLSEQPEFAGEIQQRSFINGIRRLFHSFRSLFRKAPNSESDAANDARVKDGTLKRYFARLNVNALPEATLFRIGFESFDPALSAQVANTVVDKFVKLTDEQRFSSTSGAKAYLEAEIAKIQARLETSEKVLTEYARKHKVVDVEDKGNIINSRLEELSSRLTAISADKITTESELEQARKGSADTLQSVLKEPLIKELKSSLATLEAEYSELSGVYKDGYPALQQLKQKIDRQRNAIAREVNKIVAGLDTKYQQLIDDERKFEEALEVQNAELLDLQDSSIQYNILKREWETNKELYGGLLERMKEVGVAAGMEIDSIVLVDRASVPTAAFKPRMPFNLAVATIFGLLAGIGLALLLGYLDNRIRSPEDLEQVANVVSLGIVPKVKVDSLAHESDIDLIAHHNRDNEASEAFRSVRTSLMFSSPFGAPQSILVTSAAASEGKSVTAANLALVLSQNDARVLLVDADLRRPRMHKIFQIPNSPGVSEILVNTSEISIIRRTELPTLDILPSGTVPPNPAELLGSSRMDEFLAEVQKHYDHVVIDAPPVLGLADAVILGTKTDGVMLVVSANQVTKDAVKESVKRLRLVRAPLLGAILNQVESGDGGYGYDNQYYYKYSG